MLSQEERIEVLETIVSGLVDMLIGDSADRRGELMLKVHKDLQGGNGAYHWHHGTLKGDMLEHAAKLLHSSADLPLVGVICCLDRYVRNQKGRTEGSAEALDLLRQAAEREAA
jgi:hypothetical protein